jgi:hypothetical protein
MIAETARVHLIPKFLVKSLKIIFRFKKIQKIYDCFLALDSLLLPILYPSQHRKCKKPDQKRFSEDLEKNTDLFKDQ